MNKRNVIFSICLLAIVIAVTFHQSARNNFVNWDDDLLITGNSHIKSFTLQNIRNIFTSSEGTYHPLSTLSYLIEYNIFGFNPTGFHITNILLHLINCIFTFWLIYLISRKISISLIVALLFGVHPLNVEPVAWASGRREVLYTLFFLAGLIAYHYYIRTTDKRKIKYYSLTLFLFILSLLSKPAAVVFPLVLVLFDYFSDRIFNRKILIEKVPFFLIAGIFTGINIFTQYAPGVDIVRGSTYFDRIFLATYTLAFHIVKTIMPLKLSAIYPYPVKINGFFHFNYYLSSLLIAFLVAIVIYTKKYTKKVIFGSLFFFATILPVIHIMPLVGVSITYDRYNYLSSIGLFYIFGVCFYTLYTKTLSNRRMLQSASLSALLLIICILSYASYNRCKVWKDGMSLWNDVIEKYPSVPTAYNLRGGIYHTLGQYDKAIDDYNKALGTNPSFITVYLNRGGVYFVLKEYDKAISDYTQALKINPTYDKAYYSRAVVFYNKKEYNKAVDDYTQAIRANPKFLEAYYNRGGIFRDKKMYNEAIIDFNHVIEINPNSAEAYNNRGTVYYYKKEYEKAILDFNQALKINPKYSDIYYNELAVYYAEKDYDNLRKQLAQMQELGYKIPRQLLNFSRE